MTMSKNGEGTAKNPMNGGTMNGNNGKEDPNLPAKKKAKTEPTFDPSNILDPSVQTPAREASLKESYNTATPFRHARIENVFQPDFLRRCKDQIKQHSKVNFKETDLFRVYQSIDLANLTSPANSELATNMPAVMDLRRILYSQEWRSYMERLTDLPPGTLSNQVDCACNCHAPGCHLLCHDDVIGTRKVSYIIYLTEEDWKVQEGGALEIYDSYEMPNENDNGRNDNPTSVVARREPHACPSKTLLPIFNSMAFFVVEPGVSFHAVQEVLGERPRLSVQGWYHAATAPENSEHATLSRLKELKKPAIGGGDNNKEQQQTTQQQSQEDMGGCDEGFTPFAVPLVPQPSNTGSAGDQDETEATTLSELDRTYLAQYMNETYLDPAAMADIAKRFEEDSSVQLRQFFRTEWADAIKVGMEKHEQHKRPQVGEDGYYQWGVSDEWKLVGPPHKQRYLQYDDRQDKQEEGANSSNKHNNDNKPSPAQPTGQLLAQLKQKVLQSREFARYLQCVTSLGTPMGYKGQIRRFRPGLDYTVAHYGILTHKAVLDATICFAAGTGGGGMVQNGSGGAAATAEGKDSTNDSKKPENEEKPDESNTEKGDDEDAIDEADMLWQSDDVGGFECYIEADDYDGGDVNKEKSTAPPEAADEYNAEDDTNLLSVSASNNTLSLVYRDPGTMRFIKYVGSRAPSSRWDIAMEYQVPESDNDEVEDEADEEEGKGEE